MRGAFIATMKTMVLGDGLLLGLPPYFLAIPSIATSQQLKRLLNGSADKLLYDHTMTYKHLNSDFLWVMANAS